MGFQAKPAAAAECTGSLQAKINAATPGSTVTADPCVYREQVTITKPIVLKGQSGSEIRGSDVWTGWTKSGSYWVKGTLPKLSASGPCEAGTSRCQWPEQVFFDDKPLEQVASGPESGQFAVDGNRQVVLADNPSGHTVEVTVRRQWVVGRSNDVTVQGFKMKHAANDHQRNGAIANGGYSGWKVQNNILSDAHASVISLYDGTDLNLTGNDVSRGGQLGVHGASAALVMNNNKIHHNNTEGFHPWRVGGVKTSAMKSLTADGNEVYNNEGKGLWCDVDCANVVYSNNRVHHNTKPGILFEISSKAKIFGNVVWENGWDSQDWGYGAGIVSSSSKDVEIYNNTVAWNADGISVISQDRGGTTNDAVTNVYVHDNQILAKDGAKGEPHVYSLGWLQDWAGVMYNASSNNRGANNRYFYPTAEGTKARFSWNKALYKSLTDFNKTPGEEGGRYLSQSEKDAVVADKSIPATPEPH
jgi:parallel beta-helix repeat protein